MNEITRKACTEAVGLLGKAEGLTEVRVFDSYDDELSLITAALVLNQSVAGDRKTIVYTIGSDPCTLGVSMLKYIEETAEDSAERRRMGGRLLEACRRLEFIGKAETSSLSSHVDAGLVVIDNISAISLAEQAVFYDALLRYTGSTGVPVIAVRRFFHKQWEMDCEVGSVSRSLVDKMLEHTSVSRKKPEGTTGE